MAADGRHDTAISAAGRLPAVRKPSVAALRLCHAVGLATRVNVNRWVAIDTAVALLGPKDRANEAAMLESSRLWAGERQPRPGGA